LIGALLWAAAAHAQADTCRTDPDRIAEALEQIRRSVDPCGESPQVLEVLSGFQRCAQRDYQICLDAGAERNVFDRPVPSDAQRRTITWNPDLRSELESCGGNPALPLTRDPTASLLHELVHAVQDCAGMNPGEHELEAVRIENIYRRAAGLCQRRGYGDVSLPSAMVRVCSRDSCPCSVPMHDGIASTDPQPVAQAGTQAATNAAESDGPARIGNGDHPD
jgi:hypothetical protein